MSPALKLSSRCSSVPLFPPVPKPRIHIFFFNAPQSIHPSPHPPPHNQTKKITPPPPPRYLDLRHIPYTTSIQPPQLPRPLLTDSLHLHYRRIPVLAIGPSLLCDTRLILAKLEALFPPPSAQHPSLLPATSPARETAAALARLLERWSTGPAVFFAAVGLMPPGFPLLRDPAFVRDRVELAGDAFGRADRAESRARVEAALGEVEDEQMADWDFLVCPQVYEIML